jgi:hypothetical protein
LVFWRKSAWNATGSLGLFFEQNIFCDTLQIFFLFETGHDESANIFFTCFKAHVLVHAQSIANVVITGAIGIYSDGNFKRRFW